MMGPTDATRKVDLTLSGKGVAFDFLTPCHFDRVPRKGDGVEQVLIEYRTEQGATKTLLTPTKSGHALLHSSNMPNLDGIVDFAPSAHQGAWRIELRGRGYSLSWPEGFRVNSIPHHQGWPFEITNAQGVCIIPQGPFSQLPKPHQFLNHEHPCLERGSKGNVLWYDSEHYDQGRLYRQVHAFARQTSSQTTLMLTGQAPQAAAATLRGLVIELAESVRFE